jgi:2-methylisocitrate lyase-like PEP mutase family enzyme
MNPERHGRPWRSGRRHARRAGLARISLGSAVAQAAYAVMRNAAREVLTTGTYTALDGALDCAELNGLSRS